jgi:uncharacterized protein YggT (Ycf19 family)
VEDDKLAADENRRSVQHEAVKAGVEADVAEEIAARADRSTPAESRKIGQVAGEFRGKAINEVVETEREVERGRTVARISQVVDYLFYVIYGLLALRFLLALLAAKRTAGFTQLVYTLSDPFYAPFRGIIAEPTAEGGFRLALSVLLAIFVYVLLHLAVNGLLRMLAHRKTEV